MFRENVQLSYQSQSLHSFNFQCGQRVFYQRNKMFSIKLLEHGTIRMFFGQLFILILIRIVSIRMKGRQANGG